MKPSFKIIIILSLITFFGIPRKSFGQTLFQKAYATGSNFGDYTYSNSMTKVNSNKFVLAGHETTSNATIFCVDSLGVPTWSKKYFHSTLLNGGEFNVTKHTSDGNIVSAGQTYSGAGIVDGYIIKTDNNGNLIWANSFGATNSNENIWSVAEDAFGNIYCAGQTEPSFGVVLGIIIKLDINGNLIWQKEYSRSAVSYDSFRSIIILSSGDLVVTDNSDSNFGNALIKLNSNGIIIWSKTYSSSGNGISFNKVIALPNNELAISGLFIGQLVIKTDSQGNVIWCKHSNTTNASTYGGFSLSPDSSYLYLPGVHTISYPQIQASLSKFNLSGTHLWEKEYGGCDEEAFWDMAFSNSSVYLAGVTRSYGAGLSNTNAWLVRTDTSGYTSCYDDFTSPNYQSLSVTNNTITFISNTSNLTYTAHATVVNSVPLYDSLICSSINPVGIRFNATNTVICVNSCVSFSSDSTLMHHALDNNIDFDGTPVSTRITFKWLFPGATFISGSDTLETPTNICYATPGQYNVSLIVTDGCKIDTLKKTNYITVLLSSPSPSITGNTSFCSGSNVVLDAGSGYLNYQWLPSGQTTQTISVNTIGSYSVIITSSCGNGTSTAIAITENPTPTVSITGSTSICSGSSVTLTGSGATTYSWSTSSTNTIVTVSPTLNTTYTLIGSNGTCTNSAIQTITVNNLPIANAGANQTICSGQTANLTGSGGTTYTWSNGQTNSNIAVSPNITSDYTLTVFNGACSNTSIVTVSVNTTPTVSISSPSNICSGSTVTLTALGASTYNWSTSSTNTVITVNPISNTTYTVIGSNGTCTNSAIQTITVNSVPVANAGANQTICEGQSVNLTGSGGTTYTWSSGQTTSNISVNPISTNIYTLTAFNGPCSNSDTIMIVVNPLPVVAVSNDVIIPQGTSTILTASGGGTYSWLPASGLSCINCAAPTASPLFSTQYCVDVTTNGCTTNKCINVTVDIKCGELFVPNGFSPNGDAINDVLNVYVNKTCVKDFSFLIFDRWGEKVFESTDINTSWDGTYKGKALDNAVFVYYLNISLINTDAPIIQKGNVSIIK